jgi:uncharacterized protein HemX
VIFLAAILGTVLYLTRSKVDVTEARRPSAPTTDRTGTRGRERALLGVYAVVALATALLLHHTSQQPHATAASSEGESGGSTAPALAPGQAKAFPAADLAVLRTISQDTLTRVQSGDQAAATARVKDLETTWDDDQSRLQPLDKKSWTALDGEIDDVLTSVRAKSPDPATETKNLQTLLTSLG